LEKEKVLGSNPTHPPHHPQLSLFLGSFGENVVTHGVTHVMT